MSSQERAAPEGNVPDQSGSSKNCLQRRLEDFAEIFDPPLPQYIVATILKNKKKIVPACEEGVYNNKCEKKKDPSYPDLDNALAQRLYVALNGTLLAGSSPRNLAGIWKSLN